MDLQTFRDLLTPAGRDLLAEACTAYEEHTAVALGTRLRRRHPPDLVAAAMTQAALRRRAQVKWGEDAGRMFFTRDGLEQATTGAVAAYRAGRIVDADCRLDPPETIAPETTGPPSPESSPERGARIVDLCCGIGGDLIALARAGVQVTGVDTDPLTVAIARANLAELDLAGHASVEQADAREVDRAAYSAAVADPARRSLRGRIFDSADYSPPWSFVEELLRGDACVKTAPIIPHRLIPAGVEAEWISVGGEVKEAALWAGRLRTGVGDRRRATVLPAGGVPAGEAGEWAGQTGGWADRVTMTDADDPGGAPVSPPLAYLYEPDGAVIRAGLVTGVAPLVDGSLLHPKIAYLTSDQLVSTPFASAYRVVAVLPYDLKVLKRELRDREVGNLTVKKRGVDVDPQTLRKRLGVRGPGAATVVVTRSEQGTLALLVDPTPA
ncbi:class I SAM-dependent methyltransferase [Actinopolymorpha sp. B9G3]|uniref:class I SAM-dependent methyltransferase n=1 Tax=Actinopolymorpha sp. B9G3 TaxID=3158970 RepID=UPI0032D9923E